MFSRLLQFIRQVIYKVLPYKSIETAERIETPLSQEMTLALDEWYNMYLNKAPWLKPDTVKSLNLPAFICSEIARQIILELDWDITGPADADGNIAASPRAEYLKQEFEKLFHDLRARLEQGCGAGGMAIKPYPKNGHIYYDWTTAWELYPISFGDEGELTDVIFRDNYQEGKDFYTRLERHTVVENGVRITQRAFKSNNKEYIGTEVPLTDIPMWSSLQPEATITDSDGQMFGWFRVAAANSVDVSSPMGASVFAKATDAIKQADLQYSRLLWEFEGSELAVDVDPAALRAKPGNQRGADGKPLMETPKLNERLFRGLDLGTDETYHVFNPSIRDASLINGLNQILMRVEDLCGLSRGTLSDANTEARTATELRIIKQRSYATIADNQAVLERCLRDVIRAMDKYCDLYKLAPAGEYEVTFSWDDSIITDTEQQMNEKLALVAQGLMSRVEFREWYFSETTDQAQAAIQAIQAEQLNMMALESLLPTAGGDGSGNE
jgi:A118 family predicted phage portal protein